MQPGPDMRICDPACGTGGFFLAAYDHIMRHHPNLDPDQKRHLRSGLFTGWEIVDNTARLCAMNLLLHGIERPDSDSPVHVDDACAPIRANGSTWCSPIRRSGRSRRSRSSTPRARPSARA